MQLAGDLGAASPTPSFELAAAEIAARADLFSGLASAVAWYDATTIGEHRRLFLVRAVISHPGNLATRLNVQVQNSFIKACLTSFFNSIGLLAFTDST